MNSKIYSVDYLKNELLYERYQHIFETISSKENPTVNEDISALIAKSAMNDLGAHEALRNAYRLLRRYTDADRMLLEELFRLGVNAATTIRSEIEAKRWLEESNPSIDPSLIKLASAQIKIAFDDRISARKELEEIEINRLSRLSHAQLSYIEGDFEQAIDMLNPLISEKEFSEEKKHALRLRAQAYAGKRDYEHEALDLKQLVEILKDGDFNANERLMLATAYAAQADQDSLNAAEEELKIIASGNPDDNLTNYAQKRLEYLERSKADKSDAYARLPFPTVHQKRDFCGPAVLELCLRSLGIELSQDEIANSVKRETGTPMYEIMSFLEDRNIEAHRIVATLEKLKRAIDLGFPIIAQEEYSTTNHVMVITGYDDRLGLFVCQDPMTHRAQLKSYEWIEHSGQLFGNGVVVIIGRQEEIDDNIRKKLVENDIFSHEAFALLDQADRMRKDARSEGQEAAVIDEVLVACEEALAIDPDYQLAWYRRAWAELSRYRFSPDFRSYAVRALHSARVRWSGSEWPHQLHANLLEIDGRWREAFVEHLSAHRADPDDGENIAHMSYCLGTLGNVKEGIEYSHLSLKLLPSHPWIAAELAIQYMQALELNYPDIWQQKDNSWLKLPETRPPSQDKDHNYDKLKEELDFYLPLALRAQPESLPLLFCHVARAAIDNDIEEVSKRLDHALSLHPDQQMLLLYRIHNALLAEEKDIAEKYAAQLVEKAPMATSSWLAQAEVLRDDPKALWQNFIDAVSAIGPERHNLVNDLWRAARSFGGGYEAAAVLLHQLAENFQRDTLFIRAIADQIDNAGQRGLAIRLYRMVIDKEPGDINSRYRLGLLLADDPLTKNEGRDCLAEVVSLAPSAAIARVHLSWCMHDHPVEGMEILSPVLESGDPYVYESAAALFEKMEQKNKFEKLRAQALASYPTEDDGRLDLGHWHYSKQRYPYATELLLPLTQKEYQGQSPFEEVQEIILTAFRLAGKIDQIKDWILEICKDGIPPYLAYEIFWSFRSTDYALAAESARVYADTKPNKSAALEFLAHAASCNAKAGDSTELEKIITLLKKEMDLDLDAKLDAWEVVYYAFINLDRFDEAKDVVEVMQKLNAKSKQSLDTRQHYTASFGDRKDAFAAALECRDLYPYEHVGDEMLGILYGAALDAEKATQHAIRALSIAPYCHKAHISRAMAAFASNDYELARTHLERSNEIDPDLEIDQWSYKLALEHALNHDAELLEKVIEHRNQHQTQFAFPEFDRKLKEICEDEEI